MHRRGCLSVVLLLAQLAPAMAQPPPANPHPATPYAASSAAANPPVANKRAAVLPGAAPSSDPRIATVTLQGGLRASQLIGAAVYNEQNDKVGSVDDLIVKQGDRVVTAIVSVGGFLGLGAKLVAVPYHQLRIDSTRAATKVVMPGASKAALSALPTFDDGG